METVNKRLEALLQALGENKTQFSKRTGVSVQGLDGIIGTRQSSPSFEVLNKIISSVAELNPRWLISGEGDIWEQGKPPREKPYIEDDIDCIRKELREFKKKFEDLMKIVSGHTEFIMQFQVPDGSIKNEPTSKKKKNVD